MANEQKPSKNMVRGSWFGQAEVSLTYLANNVVGIELVKEFHDAFHALHDLYEDGDDLNCLIAGLAPKHGLGAEDLPKQERFCNAIQAIKDKAREKELPLQLGYIDTDEALEPAWYVDVSGPETEVFEVKLTPYGRKILEIIGGKGGLGFSTDIVKCHE